MKYIKYDELDQNKKLYKIGFKPKFEAYAVIVIGCIIALYPNIVVRCFALFFVAVAILSFFLIKDRTVAAIGENEVYVYYENEIGVIDFDEIDEWLVRNTDARAGGIGFNLKDGSNVTVITFQAEKFRVALNKVLRNKEFSEKLSNSKQNNGGLIKRTIKLMKSKKN